MSNLTLIWVGGGRMDYMGLKPTEPPTEAGLEAELGNKIYQSKSSQIDWCLISNKPTYGPILIIMTGGMQQHSCTE